MQGLIFGSLEKDMRRPLVAGNWKMNGSRESVKTLLNGIKDGLDAVKQAEVAVCPPYVYIPDTQDQLDGTTVAWGGQDLSVQASGAYTGEVSAKMLRDVGCQYIIIGHSERRQFFGETNETVNKRLKAVLAEGLIPIVCVGEILEERKSGRTWEVVEKQVRQGLAGLSPEEAAGLIIAYEPVWAIGTGETATPDQAQEVHAQIRGLLKELYDDPVAQGVRIQYGGSVKPDNVRELMAQPDLDGALVGGASLKAESFINIVRFQS